MSTGTGSIGITKLQLALLIGTPLVIGAGIYLYNSSKTSPDDKKTKLENLKGKSISIDGKETASSSDKKKAEVETEKLTPLKQAVLYKDEGNSCFKSGKYDEAIKFYEKAIEKCPEENNVDMAIFYQNRSAAYEMLKRWNQVIQDCTKSLEYNNKYVKAYFRRAKAYEQTKDLMKCLDDITATCILEQFQNQNSIMYADRILKQTGTDDAVKGLETRSPILPSGCFIRTYFRSFVMDPLNLNEKTGLNDVTGGYLKAKAAFVEGRFDDIISFCTEEIESSESEAEYKAEALLLRSTFYLLSGRFIEAKVDLDALISNSEVDSKIRCNALIKRAALHVQIDEREKGMEDFKAAENLEPNNADIYHQRAQIYILLDQLDDALNQFEKAVKITPNHAMAFVQKCYAEYRLAYLSQDHLRLFTVMNEFKDVMERFPDCVDCYSLMAQVLSEQGQYAEADKHFETAIKKAPDAASIYVHRGIMQLQWTGNIEKALEYMEKSIEIDEKCELAYETLGTIEVQRANLHRAVELFEKALKYAKSQAEMSHLYALRNAATAQINVTKQMGIDMGAISALAGLRA
ncbi:TOMM70A family protein [Megaselia abdita]